MTRATILITPALALLLSGCRPSTPCPDCDDEPIPDLPCGGADLSADNSNCGTCDNACTIDYPGTPYEVGNCSEGECGPRWYVEQYDSIQWNGPPPPEVTCEQVCALQGTSCVAQGCSDKTGYMCSTLFGEGCSLADDGGIFDWAGACDENVPWPDFYFGWMPMLGCCCEHSPITAGASPSP